MLELLHRFYLQIEKMLFIRFFVIYHLLWFFVVVKSCYYHAQVVVEKKIMREKQLTRHDLGREKFIEEAC